MDLNAPLGMTPPPRRRRPVVLLAGGVFVAAATAAVALALVKADPRGGRPFAVAELPPLLVPPAPSAPKPAALDPMPTGSVTAAPTGGAPTPVMPAGPGDRAQTGSLEGGVMVYRGIVAGPAGVSAAAAPLVIDVTRAVDDPLGRMRGGLAPSAKAAAPAAPPPVQPRVAIFVSGMGMDAGATRTAIETMPAAVSLAVSAVRHAGRSQRRRRQGGGPTRCCCSCRCATSAAEAPVLMRCGRTRRPSCSRATSPG